MAKSCSGLIAVYQCSVHPLIRKQVTLVTPELITLQRAHVSMLGSATGIAVIRRMSMPKNATSIAGIGGAN